MSTASNTNTQTNQYDGLDSQYPGSSTSSSSTSSSGTGTTGAGAAIPSFLTLGGVGFRTEELPAEINLGGEQVIAVRKFPGGGIDIQALGAFDDPIGWEGTHFQAPDALSRCLQLDAMRIAGDPVILDFSQITRKVIISIFKYRYLNDFHIEYQIELQPNISYDLTAPPTVNGVQDQSTQFLDPNVQQAVYTQPAQQQPQTVYTVVKGDTLWAISKKYYNDPYQWPTIAQTNGVKDPKLLQIGTKLTIPNPNSTQQVA